MSMEDIVSMYRRYNLRQLKWLHIKLIKTSAFIQRQTDLLVTENEQDLYMIYKTQYKGGYMRYVFKKCIHRVRNILIFLRNC